MASIPRQRGFPLSAFPKPFWWPAKVPCRSRPHLVAFTFVTIVAIGLYAPMFRAGLPPGVDTPTFLHFSWFVQETLQGRGGLVDPYWYGGLQVFETYPPLAYSLVGLLAYATPLSLILAYKVVLLIACVGLGMATYWMASELRHGVLPAAVAAILAITAYPVFPALGVWGWFATLVALPLGVGSIAALERSLGHSSIRFAMLGGTLLGLSVLAHHMTAFAVAVVLLAWLPVRLLTLRGKRARSLILVTVFAISMAIVTIWWVIPFLLHAATVDFQREIPGIWSFSFRRYLLAIADTGLIGGDTYPTYMGLALLATSIGGICLSLMERSRTTAYGAAALVLWTFSLGEQINPLLRVRPLDGLDVARFHLFLVPFAAALGGFYLGRLWRASREIMGRWVRSPRTVATLSVAALLVLLTFPVYDAVRASQSTLQPVKFDASVSEALDWLKGVSTTKSKVLVVGWSNWDAFLVPLETGLPVMDGWYDEGTRDWQAIREVRHMMWLGNVNVPRLHELMAERGTAYLLVYDYHRAENPQLFRDSLYSQPELFQETMIWDKVWIFKLVAG